MISKEIVSDEVVEVFAAAGFKKPYISVLSDEYLAGSIVFFTIP